MYKDIIFDNGFHGWAKKYEEFSKFVEKNSSKTFLWKLNNETKKVHIFGCEKYGFGNKQNSDINISEFYLDDISLKKIALIPEKINQTGMVLKETLCIYQKTTKTSMQRANIIISGVLSDNGYIEGIMEVIELNDDLEVLKNIVSRNSHDIKNQLMLMLAMANNIQYASEDSTVNKYAYFIKDTVYSCNYMLSLMNTDADIKAEYGNKLFNVHHVISAMLDSFRCEKNIKFINNTKACNPRIYANKVLLTNVIYNIFINAIQAIEHNGKIKVTTYNKKQNPNSDFECDEWLFIEIEDDGIGIDEGNMDKIFNQFFTTKINGSGIGLYSAKLTLEKYNGTINVSSKKGEGAAFVISLPSYIE